jgi:hypothetical protein
MKTEEIKKLIDSLTDDEVWIFYASFGKELKHRNLVRTRNIVGERGEFLAIKIYNEIPGAPNLQAAPEGTQNVDALSRKGERYSIKTISEPGKLTGVFYGCGNEGDMTVPEKKFEYVVVVIIDGDFKLKKMYEISWEQFLKLRRWHRTMRAWNLSITRNFVSGAKLIYG